MNSAANATPATNRNRMRTSIAVGMSIISKTQARDAAATGEGYHAPTRNTGKRHAYDLHAEDRMSNCLCNALTGNLEY